MKGHESIEQGTWGGACSYGIAHGAGMRLKSCEGRRGKAAVVDVQHRSERKLRRGGKRKKKSSRAVSSQTTLMKRLEIRVKVWKLPEEALSMAISGQLPSR